MRDLIECLAIWLGPGLSRTWRTTVRRIAAGLTPAPPPMPQRVLPAPAPYARRPLPKHVRERLRPLDGHAIAFVRPYVTVHEQRVERERPAVRHYEVRRRPSCRIGSP
nr:hypothetical protein OH820_17945 [Streptomyces sp. NBC_00857]